MKSGEKKDPPLDLLCPECGAYHDKYPSCPLVRMGAKRVTPARFLEIIKARSEVK